MKLTTLWEECDRLQAEVAKASIRLDLARLTLNRQMHDGAVREDAFADYFHGLYEFTELFERLGAKLYTEQGRLEEIMQPSYRSRFKPRFIGFPKSSERRSIPDN